MKNIKEKREREIFEKSVFEEQKWMWNLRTCTCDSKFTPSSSVKFGQFGAIKKYNDVIKDFECKTGMNLILASNALDDSSLRKTLFIGIDDKGKYFKACVLNMVYRNINALIILTNKSGSKAISAYEIRRNTKGDLGSIRRLSRAEIDSLKHLINERMSRQAVCV